MDVYRGKKFLASTPAILKFVEMTVLVIGLVLFLVGNNCWSISSYITLFVLPCVVCTALTMVSLISGLMVVVGRRNPLTTHAWVKGSRPSSQNYSAFPSTMLVDHETYLTSTGFNSDSSHVLPIDVWFNVMAFLVMLMGSLITLTNRGCSDTSITVAAVAMGFIATILFAASAAVVYHRLVRFRGELKEAQEQAHNDRPVTINSIT